MGNYKIGICVNKKNHKCIYCVGIFVFIYLFAIPCHSFSSTQFKTAIFKTAIVVSKKIRPYIHVADGITNGADKAFGQMDVFFLSHQEAQTNAQILTKLNTDEYDLIMAIGPEAAVLVWKIIPSKKLYVAVLDPESLPQLGVSACGISLRIPVALQLSKIAQTFHTIKKIGLIFDPRHNQWFFDQARLAAENHGVQIIALPVNSKNQIAGILKKHRGGIDAIWMIPDQTVISEKIIHYVIKQGIYNKIGVIGYNSFFTRSGAFFSFEFDYNALGRQAGEQMSIYLKTGQCSKDTPVFKTIVNQKIVDKIGIRVKK